MITINKIGKAGQKKINIFLKKNWKQFNVEKEYTWKKEIYEIEALKDKSIIGFGDIKIVGGTAYMGEIIVLKGLRGQGIGHLILNHLENYAKKKKCHRFFLETSEKHTEAIKFYKKEGYSVIATLPNHRFGFTWYIFSKELTK